MDRSIDDPAERLCRLLVSFTAADLSLLCSARGAFRRTSSTLNLHRFAPEGICAPMGTSWSVQTLLIKNVKDSCQGIKVSV